MERGDSHDEELSVRLDPLVSEVRCTQSDTTEALVLIEFPNGLASYDGAGNRVERAVEVRIEFSTDGGDAWSDAPCGTTAPGHMAIAAALASDAGRAARFSLPFAGAHRVRVTRLTPAGGAQDVDTAYWTLLRSSRTARESAAA